MENFKPLSEGQLNKNEKFETTNTQNINVHIDPVDFKVQVHVTSDGIVKVEHPPEIKDIITTVVEMLNKMR